MSERVDGALHKRAAYVHIPFCHRRCPYCDFAVVDLSSEASPIERYVAAVIAEIEIADGWEPLHAINLGGGTPSVLTGSQIARIIDALVARFGLADGAEVSIEANPEDITREKAEAIQHAGVNRVSLGVQSFDDEVLQRLGREHRSEDGATAVANLRAAGLDTVNVDLIFGTPGESLGSWQDTVRRALALDTEHLSAYALTVELGTELSRQVAAGAPQPDADDQADKYEFLVDEITLDHYEVSNWARLGRECRYNLTTWAQGEYEAFGTGAHGHRNGERTRNYRRLDVYLEEVESGRRPVQGSERLDKWDREKERVFLGLRRRDGVVAGIAGEALLGTDVGQRFVAAGILDWSADRLVVRRPLLTDAVAREVLAL